MISLEESTLVNKTIRHLGYKTSKYINVDPYVHPHWIFNITYALLFISLQKYVFTFNEFYGQIGL
jgi:hypothetical protein